MSKFSLLVGKLLKQKSYDVTVLTTKFSDKLKSEETLKNGMHIIRESYIFKLSRTHYSILSIVKFARLVPRIDTVLINSPNSNILFFSLLCKLAGKTLVIFHHGDLTLPKKTGSYLLNRIIERIFDITTFISFALADKISTHTRDYAQTSRVMRYFMHKFIPFIPPFSIVNTPPSPRSAKKISKLKKGNILVGFAGRYVEEKGFDILLQAIPLIVNKLPNARFVFAGQTRVPYESFFDYTHKLYTTHSSRIENFGLLDEPDLWAFYRSLHVFVVSSRSDCFPFTQVEAALSGIPIVATDIPGARVIVKKTGCGLLSPPEDPVCLADIICNVVSNRAKYAKKTATVEKFLEKYGEFRLA